MSFQPLVKTNGNSILESIYPDGTDLQSVPVLHESELVEHGLQPTEGRSPKANPR